MAKVTNINSFEVYTITSANQAMQMSFVPEKGGVGSSIVVNFQGKEHELLFQHDHFWERGNASLPGGFPFIFPICARIARDGVFGNYLYNGELYNLPIHGFASRMPWQVVLEKTTEDTITLKLEDTEDTLKVYPWKFCIELEYKVTDNQIQCRQTYTNNDEKAMPYYAGFHPYFLTPQPQQGKEKVMLNYQPNRRFKYNSTLTDLVGTQPLFAVPASIADPVINEQLVELSTNKITTLSYQEQGFALHIEALGVEDKNMFPFVQLYTQENQPFICVEPWMSFPNALNTIDGPRWLQAKHSEHAELTVTLHSL